MWAKRAMAHSKCSKTLESERICCRQATLSVGDPNHHDFEPDFDLMAAVQQIAEMRSYQATADQDDLDDCEPFEQLSHLNDRPLLPLHYRVDGEFFDRPLQGTWRRTGWIGDKYTILDVGRFHDRWENDSEDVSLSATIKRQDVGGRGSRMVSTRYLKQKRFYGSIPMHIYIHTPQHHVLPTESFTTHRHTEYC